MEDHARSCLPRTLSCCTQSKHRLFSSFVSIKLSDAVTHALYIPYSVWDGCYLRGYTDPRDKWRSSYKVTGLEMYQ